MEGVGLPFENLIGDAVSSIRFAPLSNNLLISSWDSNLRLYDVDGSLLRLEAPSQAGLLDCCFQNESLAFSAGSDGCIRRCDLHSGTTETIGNHHDIATCVGYSDETGLLFSASLDKNIMSWDMRSAKPLVYLINMGAEVESISLSRSDFMVAVGASVKIYDLRNLERPVHLKESCTKIRIKRISSFPRGYAVGYVDGRVALEFLDQSNLNEGYTFRCHPKSMDGRAHLVPINDIVFNPLVSGTFVTGDNDGYIITWDNESKRRLYEFPRYPNSVASLSFNHGGDLLAIASSYTYQEASEMEATPQIFIQKMEYC